MWADLADDRNSRFDYKPKELTTYCERTKKDCTKNLKMCKKCKYTFCSHHITKNNLCDDCR
jgi:hypothetical protein